MGDARMTFVDAITGAELSSTDLIQVVATAGDVDGVRKITIPELKIGLDLVTRWEDLRVGLTSTRLGGSKNPGFAKFKDNGSGSQGVFCYLFDSDAEEELYFAAQMPHAMKLGSAISPHIHWSPVSNGTAGQKVSWGLEYTWQDIGGTFGNTKIVYTDTHIPADSALVGGKHYLSPFGDLTDAGANVSSILVCRIFRDATGAGGTDSYAADAAGLYVDFHVEMDSAGSVTEFSKWG